MGKLVRVVLGSYPPWWRRRYEAETAELTEQLMADSDAQRWRVLMSLLFGSIMAWAQLRRIGDYLKPESSPNEWGVVPRGSHRDIFGNRGLWPHSEAELEPDEVLLGVLDGVVGSRFIASMPMMGYIYLIGGLIMVLGFGVVGPNPWELPEIGAMSLLIGSILVRVTHSYYVAVAVTSNGVTVFRRRPVSGNTGKLIQRMSAVDPQLLTPGSFNIKVKLGDLTLWTPIKSDPLLSWMASALRR